MDLALADRTCVVTGASRGIGRASAAALLAEGARVLLVARGEEALAEAAAQLGSGDRLDTLALDVTATDAGKQVAAHCEEGLGPVDVLVNNAGTSYNRPLEELEDADWQAQWELHVMASLRLMQATVPAMAERGWGRVVNVCSSSGKRPSLSNAAYSVTKAAQLSLSRVFADSYGASGVRVNAVAPGPVETPLWLEEGGMADQAATAQGTSREEALEATRAKVPIGRFGAAEEIAAAVVFLCSEAASNVSGAAWSVDGGSVPIIL
ncbi:MAG: SDR family oxidoreductase [Thermoleophilaceae bacterium]|nr:SDR family oxidoreductase [Thermoleophilaceae bacterium]